MTTRFVGVKEFRQNMAKIAQQAKRRKQRLIILRKNEPIFELKPLSKNDRILEKLLLDIHEAEKDVQKGHLYSQKEVEARLGL